MLGLELVSIAFILLIIGATLFRHGLHLDWSQLSLHGTTADTIRLGLVLAIFSFTGFESCDIPRQRGASPPAVHPARGVA